MPTWLHFDQLAAAALYSVLGALLFTILFLLFEKLTPFSVKHELIEEHNTALAIVIGSCAVAFGLIVSSAISG